MRPVIYSGTTEGRMLSEALSRAGIRHIVCVATEYGELVMDRSEYADVRMGRQDADKMEELIRSEASLVLDATHPYAAVVSDNLRAACSSTDTGYVRILRGEDLGQNDLTGDIRIVSDARECAEALKATKGNILLTTGSKDLKVYAEDPDVRRRLYARVLPTHESISLCEDAGISGRQIIAMQGPFSVETDAAIISQYGISVLVTKSSGRTGGAIDKIAAAASAGIPVYMIGRPSQDSGISVRDALRDYFGIVPEMTIDLVGIGPGRHGLMTEEAARAIRDADIVFGASRMLEAAQAKENYPYYRAKDIIPVLEERQPERAAVLFSGDTGFYSGAAAAMPALRKWADDAGIKCSINMHPGISSISYLAARSGISYSGASIVSVHGSGMDRIAWADLERSIKYGNKTFVILSGAGDVRTLGERLCRLGLPEVQVTLGYQLSYPEEKIFTLSGSELGDVTEEGLYTAVIVNPEPARRSLIPVLSDDEMIRGKVPMTKENVRHLSIIKLGLEPGAVVYDIGSGTGSVACEIARLDDCLTVYAIEMKEEACGLIRKNIENLSLGNAHVIEGRAPDALHGLEPPTHVFIGGSTGNLRDILDVLSGMSHEIRVVMNAVSLETMAEISAVLKDYPAGDVSVEQISVNRSRELGSYHLMTAENPVMIAAFTLGGKGQ